MLAGTIRVAIKGTMPDTVEIGLLRHYNSTEQVSYIESFFRHKGLDINDYEYTTTRAGTAQDNFEDTAVFEKR